MRKINNIVIHCSAGHGDLDSVKRWWHNAKPNGLGWKTGGYHKWVDYDGKITDIYPLSVVTNGVRGHNSSSVHICYRGGVEKNNVRKSSDTRTELQKAGILNAIFEIIEELKKTQDVSDIKILGHRDFPDVRKDCPSFDCSEYSWITI